MVLENHNHETAVVTATTSTTSTTTTTTAAIDIPEHLSRNYFENVLQNGLQEIESNNCVINIININFSMGSSGGENYCSDIYRAIVEYQMVSSSNCANNNNNSSNKGDNNGKSQINKISLIIKNMPRQKSSEILDKMEFYEKEVKMFTEIIPKIEKLLINNAACSGKIAPKFYYTTEEPVRTIVLEDLNALGYKIADRHKGLDEKHSKVLLWKLAQYHAASMVLAKEQPELVKSFDKGFFQKESVETDLFNSVFIKSLQQIIDIISEWENYETIIEKLEIIKKNFKKRALNCILPKAGDVRVLNHGDLWVNNFMYKYDNNNNPCDVLFIDLQISYYSGLGLDINYFLYTSVQLDVLKTKRYELLRHYYKSLKITLEKLKYTEHLIPTWNDVKNEICDKEFFGFVSFEAILPLISMEREASKNSNLNTLQDANQSQQNRQIMFSSKRVLETMKYCLDRFDELGVFD